MNSASEQLKNVPEEQRNLIWARLRIVEDAVLNAKLIADRHGIKFDQPSVERPNVPIVSEVARKYEAQVYDLAAERARREAETSQAVLDAQHAVHEAQQGDRNEIAA